MGHAPATGTVFIVDDDPDVLNSLQFLFESEGVRVRVFEDPNALLADALPSPHDCLLLDYQLGECDGFSLIAQLRALSVKTPIVMMTVYEGLETRAAKAGVFDVLLKPHLEDNVVARVCAALGRAPH